MSSGMFNVMYQAGLTKSEDMNKDKMRNNSNSSDVEMLCNSLDRVADGLNHLADVLDKSFSIRNSELESHN